MRFPTSSRLILLTSLSSPLSVLAIPNPQGTGAGAACFDAGDCILSGGGPCIKDAGKILGTCSPPASTSTTKAGFPGLPGFPAPTKTTSAPASSGTGALCFDAGDCIFNGGGQCIKDGATSITGHCSGK
ncbi:hypothetical protein BKA65DRAFT_102490 [Rhexocercosporidium sp. MPI-PUGE-AT-0058]|nr:hypothetical protein BKA65DRAFT_102490 [Rhexocercosporidium sp. MPI-PUGE-AT-0058]